MSELDIAISVVNKYNELRKISKYNKDKYLSDLEKYSNQLNALMKTGLKRDAAISKLKLAGQSQPIQPSEVLTPDIVNSFMAAKKVIAQYGGKTAMVAGDNIVAYVPNQSGNLSPIIPANISVTNTPPVTTSNVTSASNTINTSQSSSNFVPTSSGGGGGGSAELPWPYGESVGPSASTQTVENKGGNLILIGLVLGAALYFIRKNKGG